MTEPRPGGDHRTILTGTAANVIGLLVGVLAAFGVQALLGRGLPSGGLGVVTLAVQVAFVASAGGRFGMDMTAIRRVAIDAGDDDRARLRSLVDRSTLIAVAASALLAVVVAAAALAERPGPHGCGGGDVDPVHRRRQRVSRREPRPAS